MEDIVIAVAVGSEADKNKLLRLLGSKCSRNKFTFPRMNMIHRIRRLGTSEGAETIDSLA
jgi:hypothetical protein